MFLPGYPYFKNFKRFREIVRVFSKYGFSYLFSRIRFLERIGVRFLKKEIVENPPWVNLRLAFEELGTTFIKAGQILSSRVDLLPPEYCQELKKLQDEAPAVSFEEVRRVVEEELGTSLENVFWEFDPRPLASASIAQVHRAVLKKSGEKVAVKVQKPGVREMVVADLEILSYLARFGERLHGMADSITFSELVAEFRKGLLREIDFTFEAVNARKMRDNFLDFEGVYIPRVFSELTTSRVMVMELIEGVPLSKMLKEGALDTETAKMLAEIGARAIFKMIFEDGFFHGDPHPGNLMFRGETRELVYLDFGMVGAIDRETRRNIVLLLQAALEKNAARMIHLLEEEFMEGPIDSSLSLRFELNEILEHYVASNLREINLKSLFFDFFHLLRKYQLHFPASLVSLLRALVVAEGTGRELDPEFSLAPYLSEYLRKVLVRWLSPERIRQDLLDYLLEWESLLRNFPENAREIFSQLSSGKFTLRLKSKEIEETNRRLETVSTRLSLSIVLGSLLIGSSLVYINFPGIRFLSVLGILGYAVAAFLGIVLVFEMLRHH